MSELNYFLEPLLQAITYLTRCPSCRDRLNLMNVPLVERTLNLELPANLIHGVRNGIRSETSHQECVWCSDDAPKEQ